MSEKSTAKRLAKNTLYMYIRMAFLMMLSLFTSRIVLQQLGIEDYGTYDVVGAIVAMFSSLRSLFSNSTQRFVNYEMGKGDERRIKLVFNLGLLINLIIAVVFIVGVEIVGFWFLNYKMSIAPTRLFAAKVVFQFSIFSAVISMITNPFDALIVAHERMDYYATFAIVEGLFRLGIVFLLMSTSHDKLIFYGLLQLFVSIIVLIVNIIFCRKNFKECRFQTIWDTKLFKEMSSFAGWNFLGNTAYALTQNGFNMILNVYSGLVANAARGISYQVNAALSKALDSVAIVVNPFCTKTYANGDFERMLKMMYMSSKIYFTIQACIVVPFTILSYEILYLWLGQVPEFSVGFVQLVLLYSLIRSVHYPINNLFKSAGKLKRYQIAEIIILCLPLVTSFFLLRAGFSPYLIFVSMILFEFVNYIAIITIAKEDVKLPVKQYINKVVIPCLMSLLICSLGFLFSLLFKNLLWMLLMTSIFTDGFVILYMFLFGFSQYERDQVLSVIYHK